MLRVVIFLSTLAIAFGRCDNQCNGHGTCMTDDVCQCYDNWGAGLSHDSADCSDRVCPFEIAWVDNPDASGRHHKYMECAGKGICDRTVGECACFDGYEGKGCARATCPNDCSGHGKCDYIEDLGYGATWNDWVDTKTTVAGMNTRGQSLFNDYAKTFTYTLWDKSKSRQCVCDATYGDLDCSKRLCPFGTDVLDTKDDEWAGIPAQKNQEQTILLAQRDGTYSYGDNTRTFALTFKSRLNETYTTTPLVYDSSQASGDFANDIKLALLRLPNKVIDGVSVVVTPVDSSFQDQLVSPVNSFHASISATGLLTQISTPQVAVIGATVTSTYAGNVIPGNSIVSLYSGTNMVLNTYSGLTLTEMPFNSTCGAVGNITGNLASATAVAAWKVTSGTLVNNCVLSVTTAVSTVVLFTVTSFVIASVQLSPNTGYIATSGVELQFSLPPVALFTADVTAANGNLAITALSGSLTVGCALTGTGSNINSGNIVAGNTLASYSGAYMVLSPAGLTNVTDASFTSTCGAAGNITVAGTTTPAVTAWTVTTGTLVPNCVLTIASGIGTRTVTSFTVLNGIVAGDTTNNLAGTGVSLKCTSPPVASPNPLMQGLDSSILVSSSQANPLLSSASNHRRLAATALTAIKVRFTGTSVQGPQNLLVVEDYFCGDGCTPRLTGLTLETREAAKVWSTIVEVTTSDFNSYECGRRGKCDYTTGLCQCFSGYIGDNCNTLTTLV